MLPYWLLFGMLATGALVSEPDFRRDKPFGVLLLAAAVITTAMVGLRYWVGVDFGNYLRAWNTVNRVSFTGLIDRFNGDPGFYGLMWLLKNAGQEYWSLNLICASIFTWGLVAFARTLPNPWLAITVAVPYLVIATAMAATRQATAMGFVFLALVAFIDGRNRSVFLWTAVAATFHASAILVLPFIGLSFTQSRLQTGVLLVVTVVIGYFTLGSSFETYARDYTTTTIQSSGAIFRVIMSAAAGAIYLLIISKSAGVSDRERLLWRNFSVLALASGPALAILPSSTALDRMLLYLFPIQMVSLSVFPYFMKPGPSRILLILGILAYLATVLFVFLTYAVNAEAYVPYQIYGLNAALFP